MLIQEHPRRTLLGRVLDHISDRILGHILGHILGRVLGRVLGCISGRIPGHIPGRALGRVLGRIRIRAGTQTFQNQGLPGIQRLDPLQIDIIHYIKFIHITYFTTSFTVSSSYLRLPILTGYKPGALTLTKIRSNLNQISTKS